MSLVRPWTQFLITAPASLFFVAPRSGAAWGETVSTRPPPPPLGLSFCALPSTEQHRPVPAENPLYLGVATPARPTPNHPFFPFARFRLDFLSFLSIPLCFPLPHSHFGRHFHLRSLNHSRRSAIHFFACDTGSGNFASSELCL